MHKTSTKEAQTNGRMKYFKYVPFGVKALHRQHNMFYILNKSMTWAMFFMTLLQMVGLLALSSQYLSENAFQIMFIQ